MLGRRFGWLWAAYAVSSYGSGLGLGAFGLIAVLVLHAGPAEVSALSAVGTAVGGLLAIPLGPWVEFRRKRPVMIAMDLLRFGAMLTIPVAFAFHALSFWQMLAVAVIVTAAKIAFNAASGAFLKSLVPKEHLLIANGRFEATMWTSTVVGPPLGGAAIGVFGPVTTVLADAVSYLLSALGITMIGGGEPEPARATTSKTDLVDGWRYILRNPALRSLLGNSALVNGLIMAGEPLMAVLMLGKLGFAAWQYGLAFGAPCIGGLIGARMARRLVGRFGQRKVLLIAGTLRACWPLGLAFTGPGPGGIILVIVVQFGLVTCMGVYGPVLATFRLEHTATERVARMLSAWSVTTSTSIAIMTILWGLLASLTGPRIALAIAGILLLATPFLLPKTKDRAGHPEEVTGPVNAS